MGALSGLSGLYGLSSFIDSGSDSSSSADYIFDENDTSIFVVDEDGVTYIQDESA